MKIKMIIISFMLPLLLLFAGNQSFAEGGQVIQISSTLDIFGKNNSGNQRWAVHVEAQPGESGSLKQNFESAHGPYDSDFSQGITDEIRSDAFGFMVDDTGLLKIVKGEDYIGNYFNIEQLVATSQGTTRRFINISSPWSGSYLYEDMQITGRSEISETFRMHNLGPGGIEEIPKWWHFF